MKRFHHVTFNSVLFNAKDERFRVQVSAVISSTDDSKTEIEGFRVFLLDTNAEIVLHTEQRQKIVEAIERHVLQESCPYPWCPQPTVCAGRGFCPRDPNCGE